MGIILRSEVSEIAPHPLLLVVILDCDEPTAMFCRGFAEFRSPQGFIGAHAEAMKAGWMERQSPRGRLWICPECSGKGAS